MREKLRAEALAYHRQKPAGKLRVVASKPLNTQRELSLAYSPGVAAACEEIAKNPLLVSDMTARGNLVAVISNGTAVLGLGNIGPLAGKPVMEGKAVLFKKFADLDVFDIEIAEQDPLKLIEIIKSLAPTFGGINLEDIKAPECFVIEQTLKKEMNIPVFHDDQHGTAIIAGAAIKNGLAIMKKELSLVKIVASGAGAAALSCLHFLVSLGAKKENIWVCDKEGLIWSGRGKGVDEFKQQFARQDVKADKNLADVMVGADVFLGLSSGKVVSGDMVKTMAPNPMILALANPEPEIRPEEIEKIRKDAIICTGRSDYPNQVNNVLCFPFLFRGALDVGATEINETMKQAASMAIADLAKQAVEEKILRAYDLNELSFGKNYIIPKPLDERLIIEVSSAVAKAAIDSGVATRPIKDIKQYRESLASLTIRTNEIMRPINVIARRGDKKIVYAEGENPKILSALPMMIEEKFARPILIGRPRVIEDRIKKLNLSLKIGVDFENCDPENDSRFYQYWTAYHELLGRSGASPEYAKSMIRSSNTVIGCLMVKRGEADGLICGTIGVFHRHLKHVRNILGVNKKYKNLHSLYMLVLEKLGQPTLPLFFTDTHVSYNPDEEELEEMTLMATKVMELFGVIPKVALLCHSNFGSSESESAKKMRRAVARLRQTCPFEIEGEMHPDAALDETIRANFLPKNHLKAAANLMVFPNLDAANITYNMVKMVAAEGISTGPILMGCNHTAHIMTPAATSRGIINMTAFAAADATTRLEKTK
ncbi:MAG: NADP-dependent malic enzyme [Alphaproteobacteria bacterium]